MSPRQLLLHSWCVSGETRTWFRNQVQLSIAFWQSSRLKLGVSAATCPLGISQSPALPLPPSQERIPNPHTFTWHQHGKFYSQHFASHVSSLKEQTSQRCCSHFLHLVDADWANGRDGSTETLRPLKTGVEGECCPHLKHSTVRAGKCSLMLI